MAKLNMVQAINQALRLEMKRNDKIILLGEDVGVDGGVFRVTDGLLQEFGEQRVIDTPLAESVLIGASLGLGIYGFRPVVEIQFSGFIYPGFNQLISHVARLRNRTRGALSCPIVVRSPYGGGIRALEHHSESMEALFAHIPGLKVVIPSSPSQAKGLLTSSMRDPDPVIFFEPLRLYRAIKEDVPDEDFAIPLGKAKIAQSGKDVTIISYGAMLWVTQKAIAQIGYKYDIELIDLQTIKPLDVETIIASVKKTGRCVIVHEAPRSFGIGAEIVSQINEKALYDLHAPVERVTGFDTIVPYYKNELKFIPDEERIIAAIEKVMEGV